MHRTDTVVIGAGQAGLATSNLLTEAGRDHVVLDRGRLAERWRSERWDSLRLLTPNWMTRLPGWSYRGPEPHQFMTATELVESFESYARSFSAPVQTETTVVAVESTDPGYRVTTDQGTWHADNVVIATGAGTEPFVPRLSRELAADVLQVSSSAYRNPEQLPDGGVLVVGASASGVQIADELHRSGREVVLSTGDHSRMPRRYRGMDIYWWMDRVGLLDVTIDEMPDRDAARRAPSLQLVGRPMHDDLDLPTLRDRGVIVTGRLRRADGCRVAFSDDLDSTMAASEQRKHRVLDAVDSFVEQRGWTDDLVPPDRPRRARAGSPPADLDLRAAGVSTVVWATGFARSYPWLHVPVLDANGELHQRRGLTAAAGLYVVGLRFQHYRSSNFIAGVGRDARHVVEQITSGAACHEEVAA